MLISGNPQLTDAFYEPPASQFLIQGLIVADCIHNSCVSEYTCRWIILIVSDGYVSVDQLRSLNPELTCHCRLLQLACDKFMSNSAWSNQEMSPAPASDTKWISYD